MTRRLLWVCALALMLAGPGVTQAGEVRLAIKDGRVELVARDATLREILLEWERVGGTRIVNREGDLALRSQQRDDRALVARHRSSEGAQIETEKAQR